MINNEFAFELKFSQSGGKAAWAGGRLMLRENTVCPTVFSSLQLRRFFARQQASTHNTGVSSTRIAKPSLSLSLTLHALFHGVLSREGGGCQPPGIMPFTMKDLAGYHQGREISMKISSHWACKNTGVRSKKSSGGSIWPQKVQAKPLPSRDGME